MGLAKRFVVKRGFPFYGFWRSDVEAYWHWIWILIRPSLHWHWRNLFANKFTFTGLCKWEISCIF